MILYDATPSVPLSSMVNDAAQADAPPAAPPSPKPKPTDIPDWVRSFANCVIDHESRDWPYDGHPRPYQAHRSDSGTASGAYQFIDSTWRHQSRLAGFPGYARAMLAPPAVQDAVFAFVVLRGGAGNWNGTHCGYGT
jgi:hypothetical protein